MTREQRGLTLIELLVALAIFAVLGTLTYRGTTQIVNSGYLVENELERWRTINRALYILETELLQTVAPRGSQRQSVMQGITVKGNKNGGSELSFLTLANPETVERVIFRHIDGRLEWLRRPDLQTGTNVTVGDTLLENVSGIRWRFLTERRWVERWPENDTVSNKLPTAIEIELTLPDAGVLRRMYALR